MSTAGMPTGVAKRLGYALKMAQNALRIRMDEALRPIGLTTPQYAVLSAVEAEPGLSNARLARAAFVTPQSMQAVLAHLEREGLLQRDPDPEHGRILEGRLTAKGAKAVRRAHESVRPVEDELAASLGVANVARLAASFTRCAEDLRRGSTDFKRHAGS